MKLIQLIKSGSSISYIFFADDLMLFVEALNI